MDKIITDNDRDLEVNYGKLTKLQRSLLRVGI